MMVAKRIRVMESNLSDVFEQARQLVAEADRRVAETERRRREIEGQSKLAELVIRAEEAFDFTSREKLELDPRMDVHEDMAVIEFVVRAARAIFVLAPKDDVMWDLLVVEDGKSVSSVTEIVGGIKAEPNSRRLAAARVVASIAAWVEKHRQSRRAPQGQTQVQTPQVSQQIAQPQAAPQYSSQPANDTLPATGSAVGQGLFSATPKTASPLPGGLEVQAPAYEPRDRRANDVPMQTRYEENPASRTAPAQPATLPAAPAAQKPAAPARAGYGTFGKFFGH
jgi:hypothetical protein